MDKFNDNKSCIIIYLFFYIDIIQRFETERGFLYLPVEFQSLILKNLLGNVETNKSV